MENNFTQEDVKQVVDFLNFIAEKAEFGKERTWKTEDTVKHFKLLAFMQQTLLKKMRDHIGEIEEVIEPETKTEEEK